MGPGLSNRDLGEVGGAEVHTLSVNELPAHDHALGTHAHDIPELTFGLRASSAAATSVSAAGNMLATATVTIGGGSGGGNGNPKVTQIYNAGPADVSLGAGGTSAASTTGPAVGNTSSAGGGQPHSNMQPFLTLKCIIALEGIFPPRP
jgi:microcystin-dependent protein